MRPELNTELHLMAFIYNFPFAYFAFLTGTSSFPFEFSTDFELTIDPIGRDPVMLCVMSCHV